MKCYDNLKKKLKRPKKKYFHIKDSFKKRHNNLNKNKIYCNNHIFLAVNLIEKIKIILK
jgi:hypothetical protein